MATSKNKYEYVQSPHIEARKERHPELNTKPKTLNEKIGYQITKGVGTMWAAYLFISLTLVSLPTVIMKGDPVLIVSWIAQTFLQLVLLPIIIVGQNLQAAAAEKRAILTYEDAAAVLEESIKIQEHLNHQDKSLEHLLARVTELESKSKKK